MLPAHHALCALCVMASTACGSGNEAEIRDPGAEHGTSFVNQVSNGFTPQQLKVFHTKLRAVTDSGALDRFACEKNHRVQYNLELVPMRANRNAHLIMFGTTPNVGVGCTYSGLSYLIDSLLYEIDTLPLDITHGPGTHIPGRDSVTPREKYPMPTCGCPEMSRPPRSPNP